MCFNIFYSMLMFVCTQVAFHTFRQSSRSKVFLFSMCSCPEQAWRVCHWIVKQTTIYKAIKCMISSFL